MEHIVTREGLYPDLEKVKAIKEIPCPTDVKGVQHLGGFVNYWWNFSRAFTNMETWYALLEKELLAVVYACEQFHWYMWCIQ